MLDPPYGLKVVNIKKIYSLVYRLILIYLKQITYNAKEGTTSMILIY